MRFLPQTTPDAPPPPPPPTVLCFLSLSLQTFLEVLIIRAETATKLHFTSTGVMFFLFDFGIIHHICDKIHSRLEMGQRQINWLYWERSDKLLKSLISRFFVFKPFNQQL